MKYKIGFFLLLLSFSCVEPAARRPVSSSSSTSLLTRYTKENKRLNDLETQKIAQFIAQDSLTIYKTSPYGFWYTYETEIPENTRFPKVGDEVVFSYDIRNLNDEIIYSKEVLGLKNYKVDREDFIPAIQQGIKLMKLGETVTFVIPFYSAFGIAGDGNKIGIYQSIKSTVTLINIK